MDEAKEQAWKELTADLELYRFYVELVLKAAAFVLFMTGVIISYALTNSSTPDVRIAIWLPVVVNAGMAIISFISIGFATSLRNLHADICTRAGMATPYELSPLTYMLVLAGVTYTIVFIGTLSLVLGWFG